MEEGFLFPSFVLMMGAVVTQQTTSVPSRKLPCILPAVNGIEFKKQIDQDEQLKQKSIPFVFMSTATNPSIITEAYTYITIQGYFEKQHTYGGMKKALSLIVEYWQLCKHPDE